MPDLAQRLTAALAGRYRIERPLGRGGMATVFLAEDLKHHRRVAIKVMEPEIAATIGPQRFLREIETAARLTHPHILPLHDSGEADGLLYYVTPYVAGESLRNRLAREKQLSVEEALRIAGEVAGALDYAHRQGVVHRDIKPENVLLEEGHALVADFGIARVVTTGKADTGAATIGAGAITTAGGTVGTPQYMSPEQAAGSHDLDGRSDLYSLGCLLYEMLAGQPPFTGPTAESLIHQHLSVAPRPVSELRPAAPAGVTRAIAKALAKTPADRFSTTGAFVAALERGATEPESRPKGRGAMWAAAGAVVLLAVLTGVAWWQAWGPFGVKEALPGKKEWILVADFDGPPGDSTLAPAARSLLSAALDQSRIVATVQQDQVQQALEAAGKPADTRLTPTVARELAYRSAVRTVLGGTIGRLGTGYSIVVSLMDADTARVLFTESVTARDDDALIPAMGELAKKLRRNLGENSAALRATRDLNVILTPSFEAYRKLVKGGHYWEQTGDAVGEARLYREALELDPDCAAAYWYLATSFVNQGKADSGVWACDQALKRSWRLTEEQRLRVEDSRALQRADLDGALQGLNRQLQLFPAGSEAGTGYTARAILHRWGRRFGLSLGDFRRAAELSAFGPGQVTLSNLIGAEMAVGQFGQAEKTLARLHGFWRHLASVRLAVARDDWARAESLVTRMPDSLATDPRIRPQTILFQIALLARRGEVRAAQERLAREFSQAPPRWRSRTSLFIAMVSETAVPSPGPASAGDTTASRIIARGWQAALAGDPSAARRELAGLRQRRPDDLARAGAAADFLEASIAAAENRWSDTIRLLGPAALRGDDGGFVGWGRIGPLPERWLVAQAYEHVGPPDSAAAAFERVLEPPESRDIVFFVPYAHQRLVMIYARMGRREDAERHWRAFSTVFTNPDPEVKHLLDDARGAILGLRSVVKQD